jgi:hypothetical protein
VVPKSFDRMSLLSIGSSTETTGEGVEGQASGDPTFELVVMVPASIEAITVVMGDGRRTEPTILRPVGLGGVGFAAQSISNARALIVEASDVEGKTVGSLDIAMGKPGMPIVELGPNRYGPAS